MAEQESRTFSNGMTITLGRLLVDAAQEFPNGVALQAGATRRTFAELSHLAGLLATTLVEGGFNRTRVGILLPNTSHFPVALHAVFRWGGSALLLNPANSVRETAEQLNDADVKLVITSSALRPLLPASVSALLIDDFPEACRLLRDGEVGQLPVASESTSTASLARDDDEAVVIFTAAMDGRARGAVLTHRNLVANLRSTVEAMALEKSDRVFGALPFAHAFGLTVCLNSPIAVGATMLPVPRFNPVTALEVIESAEATVLCGVPAMYMGLLSAAAKRGVPDHSLRVALCGGAPLPNQVARKWEELFGIPLRQGYGLTEASPVCLFNRVDRPNRIGTLGVPLPEVEVSVRDTSGSALGPGEVGELCIRGANVFGGYLNDPPGGGPFVEDWLRTGDLATIQDDGVRFRGTLKRMFTRNGFNVYPEEVRRTLREHESIADAVVYGRPEPVRENEIILTVVPRSGVDLSEAGVRAICAERLASYKQPTVIRIERASRPTES